MTSQASLPVSAAMTICFRLLYQACLIMSIAAMKLDSLASTTAANRLVRTNHNLTQCSDNRVHYSTTEWTVSLVNGQVRIVGVRITVSQTLAIEVTCVTRLNVEALQLL